MKFLKLSNIVFLLVLASVLFITYDGSISIAWHDYRYHTSLIIAIVGFLSLFIVIFKIAKLLNWIVEYPKTIFSRFHSEEDTNKTTAEILTCLIYDDYMLAEKKLRKLKLTNENFKLFEILIAKHTNSPINYETTQQLLQSQNTKLAAQSVILEELIKQGNFSEAQTAIEDIKKHFPDSGIVTKYIKLMEESKDVPIV